MRAQVSDLEQKGLDLTSGSRRRVGNFFMKGAVAWLVLYSLYAFVGWPQVWAWCVSVGQMLGDGFEAAVAFAGNTSSLVWLGGYVALALWAHRDAMVLRGAIKALEHQLISEPNVAPMCNKYLRWFWLRTVVAALSSVVCYAYPWLTFAAVGYYVYLELYIREVVSALRKMDGSRGGVGVEFSKQERVAYNEGYQAGRHAMACAPEDDGLVGLAYRAGYSAGSAARAKLGERGLSNA